MERLCPFCKSTLSKDLINITVFRCRKFSHHTYTLYLHGEDVEAEFICFDRDLVGLEYALDGQDCYINVYNDANNRYKYIKLSYKPIDSNTYDYCQKILMLS